MSAAVKATGDPIRRLDRAEESGLAARQPRNASPWMYVICTLDVRQIRRKALGKRKAPGM
jgi:hypothetical protein